MSVADEVRRIEADAVSSLREDIRLQDSPMQPLRCRTCRTTVEVRKSSWEQTSIQWHSEATSACLERRASSERIFTGCGALRQSVQEAAVTGRLSVTDEGSASPTPS